MNLNITDPAFLFPGISLLFLAYTNRYLTLAGIVRKLNKHVSAQSDKNREQQISSLHLRIVLIKYMQAIGIIAFLCCIAAMLSLVLGFQLLGEVLFCSSLCFMFISLVLSLIEIMKSGLSLKIELDRTHSKQSKDKSI